jgi:phosphoribosyl-ATP pyrophosphohydrolase/phosphoribosyl-AMP cyclohydrolase
VQDRRTGEVLMLAYSNEESVELTKLTGDVHFYSRSREEIWHKGETSGNYLRFIEMRADCDGDALLVLVNPEGPACHTGARSCFFNALVENPDGYDSAMLQRLYDVVRDRRANPKEGSYTNYLFDSGLDKILKKVGEESAETIIAAKNLSKEELVYEASDLVYHLIVLLNQADVSIEDILLSLALRHAKKEGDRS